ncbi:MAG: hypothetical protein WC712_10110 [Candidatus Brocadiia bacterium]
MKNLYLVLVLFAFALSAACGGGGGTDGGDPPTGTYTQSDFEGTWQFSEYFSAKVDSVVAHAWWITVNSAGEIIPEPPDMQMYPKIMGGSITLTNTSTGAFTGSLLWKIIATADVQTIPFHGTMSSSKNSLIVTTPDSRTGARVTAGANVAASYSVDRFPNAPFAHYAGTEILELRDDGTTVLSEGTGTGTWSFYRDSYVGGQHPIDTNNDGVNDANLRFVFQLGSFSGTASSLTITGMGEYNVVSIEAGDSLDTGDITLYRLNLAATNFNTADLAATWTIFGENYSSGIWQLPSFVIQSTGIPAQGDVTGGTIDSLNSATGRYEMTVTSSGSGTETIKGYLSGSRHYGSALRYNAATEAETGTMTFVNESTSNFGWQYRGGDWHVGLYKGISAIADNTVINFTSTANGQITPLAELGLGGTVTLLGNGLVSIMLEADSSPRGGWTTGAKYWAVGSLTIASEGSVNPASFVRVIDTYGDFEDVGVIMKVRSTASSRESIKTGLQGHYSVAPEKLSYAQNTVAGLLLYNYGTPKRLDFVDDSLLIFDMVNVSPKTDSDIARHLIFFTPLELRDRIGFEVYSDNKDVHGSSLPEGWIYSSGSNDWGRLGLGTFDNPTPAGHISGLYDAVLLSAGDKHSLAVRRDGSVWAWGYNGSGQLGTGSTTDESAPVLINGLGLCVAVATGLDHSVALSADGSVYAWGLNEYGQLGDGTTTAQDVPVPVPGLANIIAIAAGSDFSTAVSASGTVYAWGNNAQGQLGVPTIPNSLTPVVVTNLSVSTVYSLKAGQKHSFALDASGHVWSWGNNAQGALGLGDTVTRFAAIRIPTLSNVTQIASGYNCGFALLADGTVRAWGINTSGILGDGTNTTRLSPVAVNGISDVVDVRAKSNIQYALKSTGAVWTWGYSTPIQDATPPGEEEVYYAQPGSFFVLMLVKLAD